MKYLAMYTMSKNVYRSAHHLPDVDVEAAADDVDSVVVTAAAETAALFADLFQFAKQSFF